MLFLSTFYLYPSFYESGFSYFWTSIVDKSETFNEFIYKKFAKNKGFPQKKTFFCLNLPNFELRHSTKTFATIMRYTIYAIPLKCDTNNNIDLPNKKLKRIFTWNNDDNCQLLQSYLLRKTAKHASRMHATFAEYAKHIHTRIHTVTKKN